MSEAQTAVQAQTVSGQEQQQPAVAAAPQPQQGEEEEEEQQQRQSAANRQAIFWTVVALAILFLVLFIVFLILWAVRPTGSACCPSGQFCQTTCPFCPICPPCPGSVLTPLILGMAGSFAILAATSINNTGATLVSGGDLGVQTIVTSSQSKCNTGHCAGETAATGSGSHCDKTKDMNCGKITGFPPGKLGVGSVLLVNTSTTAQAQRDLTTAFIAAASLTTTTVLAADISNQTITPGVYRAVGSVMATGTVTFDAQSNSNAVWVLQIPGTLSIGSGTNVKIINSGSVNSLFWQVGNTVVIGTAAAMVGVIMANSNITMQTGATLQGRALTRTGGVLLDTNVVQATTPI